MAQISAAKEMQELREALAKCSSETRRLVTDRVLEMPAIRGRHVELKVLQIKTFEDWILKPECRHRLMQLRDRIDSQDVAALTASYEQQVTLAVRERARRCPAPEGAVTASNGMGKDDSAAVPYAHPLDETDDNHAGGDQEAGEANGRSTIAATSSVMASTKQEDQRNYLLRQRAAAASPADGEGVCAQAPAPAPALDDYRAKVGNASAAADTAGAGPLLPLDGAGGEYAPSEEDAYDMLLVMSEAMKEAAKGKFERGDFIGAAKAYRDAALALDERTMPAPTERTEALIKRLTDQYVTCMCNAAVAGFKAAAAATAPGTAHALVVDVCSRALERNGGMCPKARFWRARVKVRQHMYEAAEADLRAAVEEEEQQEREQIHARRHPPVPPTSTASPTEQYSQHGQALPPQASKTQAEPATDDGGGDHAHVETVLTTNGGGAHRMSSNGTVDTTAGPATHGSVHGPHPVDPQGAAAASAREIGGRPKAASEASRWLARVRATIAHVNAERAKAAEESRARETNASAARKQEFEAAQNFRRHGPGFVPRRPHPVANGDGVESGERGVGRIENAGRKEDLAGAWRVPKPPALRVEGISPAVLLNEYSTRSKFQVAVDFEQVRGESRQMEHVCKLAIGPNDRVVGTGRASSTKAAKQEASCALLKNAALMWNSEHPDDLIDMETMEPIPNAAHEKKARDSGTEITEEIKKYLSAWTEMVTRQEVHQAWFPVSVDSDQRKYVYSVVDQLPNRDVLYKSWTINRRRQLSVMRRAMMEGLAFMSGDQVVVIDVPKFPTLPEDVSDMASITRPPPKRDLAGMRAAIDQKNVAANSKVTGKSEATAVMAQS